VTTTAERLGFHSAWTFERQLLPAPEAMAIPTVCRTTTRRVLVAGTARAAIERAARIGDGFAAVFQGWGTAAEHVDWYRSAGGTGEIVLRDLS
jgi:alkanesulfonate monooxygenase SsuD/methylene tetrahydromethanopterin reductase-like flavin-dependent oxidoreductase (luciferase family)